MADTGLQPDNLVILFLPYSVAVILVVIRLCKRTVEKRFSLDDGLIAIAMLLNTSLTITTYIFIDKSYTGYRPENIPEGAVNKVTTAKLRYINSATYHPTLNLIKISFLVTLIRLQSSNRWIRTALWSFLTITIAVTIAITITAIVACEPIPRYWDRTIPGRCRSSTGYVFSGIITTIISDVLVTLIPTWIVYGLQMPWKTKAIILCFMSLGLFVTAVTIYRLIYFIEVFRIPDPVRNESPYNIRTPLSNLEVNVSAIASCGPTIKWLLGMCIPFFDTQSKRPSGYQYSRNITLRHNDSHTGLEPTVVGDEVVGTESNEVIRLENQDQVVLSKNHSRPQTVRKSNEQRTSGDEGSMNTASNGRYVKYNATQPVDMV